MRDVNHSPRRRRLVLGLAAGALSLPVSLQLRAATLPHVTLDDPAARALKYTEDASSVAAETRGGADRQCDNCNFYKPTDEPGWGSCTLFPGKAVAAAGWCSGYVKMPG